MFQGATDFSLDAKGRLTVPTKHRDALALDGAAVVVTAHPDGCLALYPRAAWELISARIQALPSGDAGARAWRRLMVGHAEEQALDGAGRIMVSPVLRKFAGLEKQVTVAGMGGYFEIWDAAAWQTKIGSDKNLTSSTPLTGAESFSL